jgi:hypothetical protein
MSKFYTVITILFFSSIIHSQNLNVDFKGFEAKNKIDFLEINDTLFYPINESIIIDFSNVFISDDVVDFYVKIGNKYYKGSLNNVKSFCVDHSINVSFKKINSRVFSWTQGYCSDNSILGRITIMSKKVYIEKKQLSR